MECNFSTLRDKGLLKGTIKEAKRKRADRAAAQYITNKRAEYRVIELGPDDTREVDLLAYADRPRVQRWASAKAAGKQSYCRLGGPQSREWLGQSSWGIDEIDAGRYSRRCRYRKVDYHPFVRSYGYATETRLVATIWDKRYRYRAPRGWVYGMDTLGIYIRRKNETRATFRYHLTSDDVRGGLAAMRAAGIQHERQRREATRSLRAQKRAIKAREAFRKMLPAVGVWVSFEDSQKVGNCASGTISWGRSHGLDHRKRYPYKVIERLSKTHYSIDKILAAAEDRTIDDLERGYCLIN
tara:strand:+ start:8 stop:898 length:891 start_codon:yes stop_codon:yes gene_type:complete